MKRNIDFATKRKIACGVLIFLGLTLLCLVTNLFSFYKSFLIGTFGLVTYPLIILGMGYCVLFLMNKVVKFEKKSLFLAISIISLLLCILQLALTSGYSFESFGAYVADCYNSQATPAGALFAIIVYPFKYLFFEIGAYIIFAIAIIALIAYAVDYYFDRVRSGNRNASAKIEKYDAYARKDPVMELRASVDRLSVNNATKYEDDSYSNNNFNTNSNLSSLSNENNFAPKKESNDINNFNQFNNFNTLQSNVKEENKSESSLLTEKVKAKLGLIKSEDLKEDEEEVNEDYQGKSEAFRTLYPDKCKGSKTQTTSSSSTSYNSLSRYFDNNDDKKKENRASKEYREKYKDYTISKYDIGYNYLNDNISNGIISGDDYKKPKSQSSTAILSDKDKQKADEILNNMKREPKVRYKLEEKRIGDGLILSKVPIYEEYEQFSENESNVESIEKFESKPATTNVVNNVDIQSTNSSYNDIKQEESINKLNQDYYSANGIINASEYKKGPSRRVQYSNSEFYKANGIIDASEYNSTAPKKTFMEEHEYKVEYNPNGIIDASQYALYKENITKYEKEEAEKVANDLKTVNLNSNSYKAVQESKQEDVVEEKEISKPVLKVDDEEINVAISTDFEAVNKEKEEPVQEVEEQEECEIRSSILPKSSSLSLNKDCENEYELNDDEIINQFEEISLSKNNNFAPKVEEEPISSESISNDNVQDFSRVDEMEKEQFTEDFEMQDYEISEEDESLNIGGGEIETDEDISINNDNNNANISINNNANNLNNKKIENYSNLNNSANKNGNESTSLNNATNASLSNDATNNSNANANVSITKPVEKVEEKKEEPYVPPKPYNKPPVDYLTVESTDMSELVDDTEHKSVILENSLESFKVPAKVSNVVIGPAVTRYEMTMPAGISVKRIVNYADDIAMALEARGAIRIEAPIPGKNAVGIEVPNEKSATIGFKEVFESGEFEASKNPLNFVLGKDISGKFIFCNLAKAPHLLVAGSTGSGKSVCLNILILSIIYKSSPEDVRLVLIDPKRVEFAIYEDLPHLMLPHIITEPEKAVNAFTWAINEMEKRYTLFQSHKVRDIGEYNQLPDIVSKKKPKMPYIVMIVDELADLMTVCKKEIEEKIARIAAKARSAGIHLVLATQRPSIDVITGTIKNNLPTRIAFSLTSFADSKTILDQGGAEKLLGKGDMLYAPQDQSENIRIQAPFVTGQEINQIVEYVKAHNEAKYEDNIINKMLNKGGDVPHAVGIKDPTEDEMFIPAVRVFLESNQASSSLLQRRLGVGWNRASKLTDAIEELGYISRPDGNNKRQILITKEQFRELYGDID